MGNEHLGAGTMQANEALFADGPHRIEGRHLFYTQVFAVLEDVNSLHRHAPGRFRATHLEFMLVDR